MGKLRMKETEYDRDRESAEHRKKRRRRRAREEEDREREQSTSAASSRRQTASGSASPSRRREEDDSDSYVPPRPSKDRPYVPYSFDDDDEESKLPLPQSHKRDKAFDEEAFNERLFEAMREDEGHDPLRPSARETGYGLDYREALPDRRAFGRSSVLDDSYVDPVSGAVINRVIFKDAMTEAEYADHIRTGMYKRTRKEEIARQERAAAERKAREKKKAEEIQRTKELEAERMRKLEERARRKAQQGSVKSREAYQQAWARLVDPARQKDQLTLDDFPWPHASEQGEMTTESVKRFLLDHLNDIEDEKELDKRRKQAIRTAVLAYHPDRFERYVLRVKPAQQGSVRDMGLRVSQILNEVLNAL